MDDTAEDAPAAPRTTSPLTGWDLRKRALELQTQAARLPTARASGRIRDAVSNNAVVVLRGTTGSGKSTQMPQIMLDMVWQGMLRRGSVVVGHPLVVPLRDLHARLEEEMDARGCIHLASSDYTAPGKRNHLSLMSLGVLVQAWWDIVEDMAALICDEAHIRSLSYSHLFRLLLPRVLMGRLKVVVMSATLSLSDLQSFFSGVDMAVVDIRARQYPIYRFEPEQDAPFEDEAELQNSLVSVCMSEAELDIGSILVFVRGKAMVDTVAGLVREQTGNGRLLDGWRVLAWYSRADDEAKDHVLSQSDADFRTVLVTTDGLGAGKTFTRFRTVISSCESTRPLAENMTGVVMNSQHGVLQEGGRVARADLLGPGRHILLRRMESMPEVHAPEILTSTMHKTTLCLVRDGAWSSQEGCAWLAGERPAQSKLDVSFAHLVRRHCISEREGWWPTLTNRGHQILRLPTSFEFAAWILEAQDTIYLDNVLAGAAFLDAAAGGSFEIAKGANMTRELSLCGLRASGEQDDFLRFGHVTMAAHGSSGDLKSLAARFNICMPVLIRAADIYRKLLDIFPRAKRLPASAQRLRHVFGPTPSGDGLSCGVGADGSCAGAQMASMLVDALPEHVGMLISGSKVYQLGSGQQILVKGACSARVFPLLQRGHPWMGSGVHQHVDAVSKYFLPLPMPVCSKRLLRNAMFSDSTFVTDAGSLRRSLIGHMRRATDVPSTYEVTIKGGYSIRAMARDIAEVHFVGGHRYDTLLCVYQISDRAWVAKSNGVPHVASTGIERWTEDINLFCDVVQAIAENVVVATCKSEAFPAFQRASEQYDHVVETLRRILTSRGVAWCSAHDLIGLETYDGYHFCDSCSSALLQAADKWFREAAPIDSAPPAADSDSAVRAVLSRALAPDVASDVRPEFWWDMRSQVSGGIYQPWCLACSQWCRGGHDDGATHAGNVLRRYGVNTLPAPPAAISNGLCLPAGVPKTLRAEVAMSVSNWQRQGSGENALEVHSIQEAGLRCFLGNAPAVLDRACESGNLVVNVNGRDPSVSCCQPTCVFSFWTQQFVSDRPDGHRIELQNEYPAFETSNTVVKRTDQYFGIIDTRRRFPNRYLWHCCSTEPRLATQGRHINTQLVGFASDDIKKMVYPSTVALTRDQGAHNMCLVDPATGATLYAALSFSEEDQNRCVAYGVGGQYAEMERGFCFGVRLYSLESQVEGSPVVFKPLMLLADGHHAGCLELRPKFDGVGEFDGQSSMIYFKKQWLLYTRANCGVTGHRQVQVCVGTNLHQLEPFSWVSFAGVPVDADIYFAHIYVTTHQTVAAIFPMAAPPVSGSPTSGGIYIAESVDGLSFGPPVLLRRSSVYLRRTADLPVRWTSLELTRGKYIDLPLHLESSSRTPADAPGQERFEWWRFPWPAGLRVATEMEIREAEPIRAHLRSRSESARQQRSHVRDPEASGSGSGRAESVERSSFPNSISGLPTSPVTPPTPSPIENTTDEMITVQAPPIVDPRAQAVLDAWHQRRAFTASYTAMEFEDWRFDNDNEFHHVAPALNFTAVEQFFSMRSRPSRVEEKPGVAMRSIADRMETPGDFDINHFARYNPLEGDCMGLFFTLLLGQLPMHKVAPVWSSEKGIYITQYTATVTGFHRKMAGSFKKLLGEKPTLHAWQRTTVAFLKDRFPLSEPNKFKWRCASISDGTWLTLSSADISLIAYETTFQFACGLLQHEAASVS